MPPVTSVYSRIADAVTVILVLIERLEEEISEKPKRPYGGFGTGKGGHGPLASWNSAAAMLVMEIHSGVRRLEEDVKYQLAGHLRVRGGSDGNTSSAFEGLPALVAGVDQHLGLQVARQLERWAYRARLILGEVEPYTRVPRPPGQPEAVCPFCRTATLRMRSDIGRVMCIRYGCKDPDGNTPAAHVEWGDFSGEPLLVWASGEVGVNAGGA